MTHHDGSAPGQFSQSPQPPVTEQSGSHWPDTHAPLRFSTFSCRIGLWTKGSSSWWNIQVQSWMTGLRNLFQKKKQSSSLQKEVIKIKNKHPPAEDKIIWHWNAASVGTWRIKEQEEVQPRFIQLQRWGDKNPATWSAPPRGRHTSSAITTSSLLPSAETTGQRLCSSPRGSAEKTTLDFQAAGLNSCF